jgi:arsenate reductase
MALTLFGIPNCDTVKKARRWLDDHGIKYTFHDYKKQGADEAKLRDWTKALGWEKVLNRAGTTFRKVPEPDRADLDADKAIALMLAYPSMIKRPLVEYPGGLLLGFREDEWEKALS